jgi:hypothetical protein
LFSFFQTQKQSILAGYTQREEEVPPPPLLLLPIDSRNLSFATTATANKEMNNPKVANQRNSGTVGVELGDAGKVAVGVGVEKVSDVGLGVDIEAPPIVTD